MENTEEVLLEENALHMRSSKEYKDKYENYKKMSTKMRSSISLLEEKNDELSAEVKVLKKVQKQQAQMTEFPINYDDELLGIEKDQQPSIIEDRSEEDDNASQHSNSPARLQINDELANDSLLNLCKAESYLPTPSGSFLKITTDDTPCKNIDPAE